MGTQDTRRQFDEIVGRLTAEYPSLTGKPWPDWPRPVLITVLVVGGLTWGLLSVAMVAWGAAGVLLTVAVVAVTALAGFLDARRRR